MRRTTQKFIKNHVRRGWAIDVTNDSNAIKEPFEKIAFSVGLYGCNGLLLRGHSGQLYAVTARTTAIFLYL